MELRNNRLDKIFNVLPYICVLIIGIMFFSSAVMEPPTKINVNVSSAHGHLDTVKQISTNVILGTGKLQILHPSKKMQYLTPGVAFDFGYTSLFLLCGIVLLIFFLDFSYKNPFTQKARWGVRIFFVLMLAFMIANMYRLSWFADQITELTGGQYLYDKPNLLDLPEFWILAVLMRLLRMFSQGIKFQKDSQLTI